VRLPEPEALTTRTRRSNPPPNSPNSPRTKPTTRIVRPAPAERLTQPEIVSVRPRLPAQPDPPPRATEAEPSVATLRKQLAALQQELTQAQQRLAKEQAERAEDADRMSDMLTRVTRMETIHRAGEERAARTAKDVDQLAKVTADLESEKATSQWLRTAGEQTTRELATFRARERDDDAQTAKRRDEVAAREQAIVDLAQARADLETALASGDEAKTRVSALEEELATAQAEGLHVRGELDEELGAARADAQRAKDDLDASKADAQRTKDDLDEQLRTSKADADRAKHELDEQLRTSQADAQRTKDDLDEQLRASKADAERAREDLEAEHRGALDRAQEEHVRKASDAARDADEQIRTMAENLVKVTREMDGLRTEKEALARDLAQSEARSLATSDHLEPTRQLLSTLDESLRALARSEEQIIPLREQAAGARQAIVDQASALRLALRRIAEAAAPYESADALQPDPEEP
jgi:chemotaxis protein MotB